MGRGTDLTDLKRVYRTRSEGDFPSEIVIKLQKEWDLKYGENPNQQGAIYFIESIDGVNAATMAQLTDLVSIRSDGEGKGGLSGTNTMDIARAMDNLKWFTEPTCVIMKHNIVSGFATQLDDEPLENIYRRAREADRRSNFGGTVAFNVAIDQHTADAMLELYPGHIVDVVAAPEYESGVLSKLEKGAKNARLSRFSRLDVLPRYQGDETYGLVSIKEMPTGRLMIQDVYLTSVRSIEDTVTDAKVVDKEGKEHIVMRDPTKQEAKDLLAAWYLNITGARSNGVVAVRDGVLVAMGSGQVERVGAVEQMLIKGIHKAFDREELPYDALFGIRGYTKLQDNPFKGASVSSDAFYPFNDSIERLHRLGVTATIQPMGSVIGDPHVIDAVNKYKMAMPATKERCFGHF